METAAVVALRRGSDAVLGCAFIGLLLIGIQTAVWGLMKQYGAKHDFPGYLLSFLPSIALWCAMGDQTIQTILPSMCVVTIAQPWFRRTASGSG